MREAVTNMYLSLLSHLKLVCMSQTCFLSLFWQPFVIISGKTSKAKGKSRSNNGYMSEHQLGVVMVVMYGARPHLLYPLSTIHPPAPAPALYPPQQLNIWVRKCVVETRR